MSTVLPQRVPVSNIPVLQTVNPTDKILVYTDTFGLVPWGSVVIGADQVDFYTTIETLSANQVVFTSEFNTVSTIVIDNQPKWDSTYSTVNQLSTGWLNTPVTTLQLLTYISNGSIGYTGGDTPLNNPIIIGFNGNTNYGSSSMVDVLAGQDYVNKYTDNPFISFAPGTYRIQGTLYSSSNVTTTTSQYIVAIFAQLPTLGNAKTYSVTNTPTAKIYSTLCQNTQHGVHTFDGYFYCSQQCYGLVLFANNGTAASTTIGAGVNSTLTVYGASPQYGGLLNVFYISENNILGISTGGNSVATRPSL